MAVFVLVKNHDSCATVFGAHVFVRRRTTLVLSEGQFCDGRHKIGFTTSVRFAIAAFAKGWRS